MNIIRITALKTNYIWIIYNYIKECIIIDPGETVKILQILKKFELTLRAILLTHCHEDHVGGVRTLLQLFPTIEVYGPKETQEQGTNMLVSEGDVITLLSKKFKIFNFPGHTPNHIGFYSNPWLFCGDTVFSAGCGTIYSGYEQKMFESFIKIQHLPHHTLIFSGHEYTLPNIQFAASILPNDKYIIPYRNKIIKLRKKNQPTIPSTIQLELKVNPFFRCNNLDIQKTLNCFSKKGEEWKIFSFLREKKNLFNYVI